MVLKGISLPNHHFKAPMVVFGGVNLSDSARPGGNLATQAVAAKPFLAALAG